MISTGSTPNAFTADEGRKFGLTVGGVFVAVAGVAAVRHRSLAMVVALGIVGLLLILAALVMPRRLGPVFRAWMGLAMMMSRVTTPVILAIIYFLLITPIGFLRRMFGGNPLVARAGAEGYWATRDITGRHTMDRQF